MISISRLTEKCWTTLAWLMPKKLVYWCSIRLMVNATTGEHSSQVVPELTAMDALKRWMLVLIFALSFATPTFGVSLRPLSVWYQSKGDLAKWKARGVTILVGYESEGGSVSLDDWCKTASDLGLDYILQAYNQDGSDAGTSKHWDDVHCIAINGTIDEPNQKNANKHDPARVKVDVAKVRAKTSKPVFVNLDGSQLLEESAVEVFGYVQAGDWICYDRYSINNGYGMGQWNTEGVQIALMMKGMCSGKRLFIACECSDQNLRKQGWIQQYPEVRDRMRGPTTDEFIKLFTDITSWGATPMLFPDVIGQGFESRDGTPENIDAALKGLQAFVCHHRLLQHVQVNALNAHHHQQQPGARRSAHHHQQQR
jgi:hypothetical protein